MCGNKREQSIKHMARRKKLLQKIITKKLKEDSPKVIFIIFSKFY